MPGVSVKPNASCENDWKFRVEIEMNCRNAANSNPANPPTSASSNDSSRNAASMDGRRKPSARSVPISAVRMATAEYMVMAAPIMAPSENITDNTVPRIEINVDSARDWSS